MRVQRFDTQALRNVRKDARGFLRVPAALTRVGVFTYKRADGSEVREYRPPEEVFAKDSTESLKGAPVTDLHPSERVDARNVRQLGVGRVGDDVRDDGMGFVEAPLTIEDVEAIAKVERGDRKELSCGYSCRIDDTSGVSPEGERYDCIQREIVYNHVALGPEGWGRAGRNVALRTDAEEPAEGWPRLDAGDAVLATGDTDADKDKGGLEGAALKAHVLLVDSAAKLLSVPVAELASLEAEAIKKKILAHAVKQDSRLDGKPFDYVMGALESQERRDALNRESMLQARTAAEVATRSGADRGDDDDLPDADAVIQRRRDSHKRWMGQPTEQMDADEVIAFRRDSHRRWMEGQPRSDGEEPDAEAVISRRRSQHQRWMEGA